MSEALVRYVDMNQRAAEKAEARRRDEARSAVMRAAGRSMKSDSGLFSDIRILKMDISSLNLPSKR